MSPQQERSIFNPSMSYEERVNYWDGGTSLGLVTGSSCFVVAVVDIHVHSTLARPV